MVSSNSWFYFYLLEKALRSDGSNSKSGSHFTLHAILRKDFQNGQVIKLRCAPSRAFQRQTLQFRSNGLLGGAIGGGESALLKATKRGDITGARQQLSDGTDVNCKDAAGASPLYVAAHNGQVEMVALLLAVEGVDVNSKSNRGWTPLYVAASSGRVEVVQLLLAAPGVQVNASDNRGWTALHVAARNGHVEVSQLLLAVPGIDANVVNNSGSTAERVARVKGHHTLARLINESASLTAMDRATLAHDPSALRAALRNALSAGLSATHPRAVASGRICAVMETVSNVMSTRPHCVSELQSAVASAVETGVSDWPLASDAQRALAVHQTSPTIGLLREQGGQLTTDALDRILQTSDRKEMVAERDWFQDSVVAVAVQEGVSSPLLLTLTQQCPAAAISLNIDHKCALTLLLEAGATDEFRNLVEVLAVLGQEVPSESIALGGHWEALGLQPEMSRQSNSGVLLYLREVKEGKLVCRLRMFVIGDPGHGKTRTLQRLRRGAQAVGVGEEEGMTEGIAMDELELDVPDGAEPGVKVMLNTWDCGGQAEYQNTHPIFFTDRRALVMVVFSARHGVRTCEPYLRTVCASMPTVGVVVVATHMDEVLGREETNRVLTLSPADQLKECGSVASEVRHLRSKFPNIRHFTLLDNSGTHADNTKQLDHLRLQLAKLAWSTPHVRQRTPVSYERFRDSLRRERRFCLDWPEVMALAKSSAVGMTDDDAVLQAIDLFDVWGDVMKLSGPQPQVLVQPQQLANVMSCVVTARGDKQAKLVDGVLDDTQLSVVWGGLPFSTSLHEVLIGLLERYDLALPLPLEAPSNDVSTGYSNERSMRVQRRRWLVPAMLKNEAPYGVQERVWSGQLNVAGSAVTEGPDSRCYALQFVMDHMPVDLVAKLQVRLVGFSVVAASKGGASRLERSESWWQGGMMLQDSPDPSGQQQPLHIGLLTSDPNRSSISVLVRGPNPEGLVDQVQDALTTLLEERFHGVTLTFTLLGCPVCGAFQLPLQVFKMVEQGLACPQRCGGWLRGIRGQERPVDSVITSSTDPISLPNAASNDASLVLDALLVQLRNRVYGRQVVNEPERGFVADLRKRTCRELVRFAQRFLRPDDELPCLSVPLPAPGSAGLWVLHPVCEFPGECHVVTAVPAGSDNEDDIRVLFDTARLDECGALITRILQLLAISSGPTEPWQFHEILKRLKKHQSSHDSLGEYGLDYASVKEMLEKCGKPLMSLKVTNSTRDLWVCRRHHEAAQQLPERRLMSYDSTTDMRVQNNDQRPTSLLEVERTRMVAALANSMRLTVSWMYTVKSSDGVTVLRSGVLSSDAAVRLELAWQVANEPSSDREVEGSHAQTDRLVAFKLDGVERQVVICRGFCSATVACGASRSGWQLVRRGSRGPQQPLARDASMEVAGVEDTGQDDGEVMSVERRALLPSVDSRQIVDRLLTGMSDLREQMQSLRTDLHESLVNLTDTVSRAGEGVKEAMRQASESMARKSSELQTQLEGVSVHNRGGGGATLSQQHLESIRSLMREAVSDATEKLKLAGLQAREAGGSDGMQRHLQHLQQQLERARREAERRERELVERCDTETQERWEASVQRVAGMMEAVAARVGAELSSNRLTLQQLLEGQRGIGSNVATLMKGEHEIFRYFVVVPKPPKAGLFKKLRHPREMLHQTLILYPVCPHGWHTVERGYEVVKVKEWVQQCAAVIKLSLMVLATASAAGRLLGVPLPRVDVGSVSRLLAEQKLLVSMGAMLQEAGVTDVISDAAATAVRDAAHAQADEASICAALEGVCAMLGNSVAVSEASGEAYRNLRRLLFERLDDRSLNNCGLVPVSRGVGNVEFDWVCPQHIVEWKNTECVTAQPSVVFDDDDDEVAEQEENEEKEVESKTEGGSRPGGGDGVVVDTTTGSTASQYVPIIIGGENDHHGAVDIVMHQEIQALRGAQVSMQQEMRDVKGYMQKGMQEIRETQQEMQVMMKQLLQQLTTTA